MQRGLYSVQEYKGQSLAHSLRTGQLWPVPACVQPIPVGPNTGNEANWAPVEAGRIWA